MRTFILTLELTGVGLFIVGLAVTLTHWNADGWTVLAAVGVGFLWLAQYITERVEDAEWAAHEAAREAADVS